MTSSTSPISSPASRTSRCGRNRALTVKSPESNGIAEAFVKTLKRDYVHVTPLPDAVTVLRLIAGWIEDYNDNHPHSGLKMRSPREFIAAQTATA